MDSSRYRFPALLLVAGISAVPLAAQETIERTPNLSGSWIGQTGILYVNLPARFTSVESPAGREVSAQFALDFGLGLPHHLLAGVRFAPESPVVASHPTEWEVLARYRPIAQALGHGLDVGTTWAWNGAAGSLDGELSLARWFGPLRLIGAFRTLNNAFGSDDSRMALTSGVVLHPVPGRLPIALSGDIAALSERLAGEEIAWSAGVQLGVSFTTHTLSLFATNTASPTLQGSSRGDGTVRFGLELTVPIPTARFLGQLVPREVAEAAVVSNPEPVDQEVRIEMARYLFLPKRIVIPAGTTLEWTNADKVLHTVNAEDGAYRSGPIQPGQSWRARFERPGRYLYYCGPHPFMKGEILVQ